METKIQVNGKEVHVEHIKCNWDNKQRAQIKEITLRYLEDLLEVSDKAIGFNAIFYINYLLIDEACNICFEDFTKQDTMFKIGCECKNVFYHHDCIMKWYKIKRICPTCRKRFNKDNLIARNYNNRYKQNKVPQETKYQCDGKTHKRKSVFKNVDSTIKHLRDKHNVNVNIQKIQNKIQYECCYQTCNTSNIKYSGIDFITHLKDFHDNNCISITY